MRQLLLVSLALVTSVYAGSLAARQKRWIMHGVQSKEGAWPFMVSLWRRLWKGSRVLYCAGTLISKSLVLTARHCARRKNISVVVFDYNKRKDEPYNHKSLIKEKIHFPNFTRRPPVGPLWNNDGTLLVLKTPVKDCDVQKTVLLPFKNPRNLSILAETHEAIDTSEADRCIVMGWGRYIPGKKRTPDVLRETNFSRIIPYDECMDMGPYHYEGKLPKSDICFGDNVTYHSGCKGDSGGPAVCQSPGTKTWYQSGIVSWGNTICKIGKLSLSVFVSVHYHLNTILRLIKEKDTALYADFWNSMQECHGDEVSIYECTLPPSHADRKKIEQMGIHCL